MGFIWNLQSLWPFSLFRYDDLKVSRFYVNKLSIPELTKQFVYAISDPESGSVIYILSVLNLSERSALDAECLIREVKPDAVVAQIGLFPITEIQSEVEEIDLHDSSADDPVPTSVFGVIKKCLFDKISRDEYESVAGNLVLREIFGVGFHGHLLAAKNVAEEVGSSFIVIESPFVKGTWDNNDNDDGTADFNSGIKFHGTASSLAAQTSGSLPSLCLRRFGLGDEGQLQIVKVLSPYMGLLKSVMDHSNSDSETGLGNIQSTCDYEVPPFAKSIYPLLVDLHNIFADFPCIRRALRHAQKLLADINKGEVVNEKVISEVYNFRLAVEGLRIALNNTGQLPIKNIGKKEAGKIDFSRLSVEEKSHALFAKALESQTKHCKTIVAVVDASSLAGLRNHWGTPLPQEIEKLVGQLVTNCGSEKSDVPNNADKKQPLASKPIVAVSAGVTAFFGASSLSKVLPASTFVKIMALKVPASLKIFLIHTEKVLSLALRSKVVGPGMATTGAKTTSALKTAVSAEKIRAVAHSVIASLEKSSFSATRTAFYEIMRQRKVKPVGVLPWAAFTCSIGTCTGLLMYGDGIECAAESLPAAPSIANLGRGIRHLHLASQAAMETDGIRLRKSIESLVYSIKKARFQ